MLQMKKIAMAKLKQAYEQYPNTGSATPTADRAQYPRSVCRVCRGGCAFTADGYGLYKAGMASVGQRMSDSMLLVASIYRTAYAVVGSYITAKLAPYGPIVHALIGGFIGLVLRIVGVVVSWNHVATMGPRWYPISLAVTALPAAWLGGRLPLMQLQNSAYK